MRDRATLPKRTPSKNHRRSSPAPSALHIPHEFMDLALEAARCRELPTFLAGLAVRACEMLKAEWGAVGEIHGSKVELHRRNQCVPFDEAERSWLAEKVKVKRPTIEVLAWQGKSAFCVFYPIYASDYELMGCLCLRRPEREISAEDERLLTALSSYAALVMEKVRRFSQLERSKKQWVEDIDAISDYIVVHDQAWNIVRTNRSLASHIGIPPVALVGEAMRSLRHIAETGSALPCPFCQDTFVPREEYIATGQGRTFLVSTSRTRGATEEEGRTIHVLKDISDRREAERRYRELFDNIQEGLFFATPEGQFLDVNDAMVRMLGYETREELLRADVSAHLYPTREAKERLVRLIAERGALRNYEEILRRRDGSLLHTLQNISAVRDAQGHVVQIRGLMLDVTEQKTFQSQLQRERDLTRRFSTPRRA
jgi:PAS domain S-box-containing protein